jgi:hypothetical protein
MRPKALTQSGLAAPLEQHSALRLRMAPVICGGLRTRAAVCRTARPAVVSGHPHKIWGVIPRLRDDRKLALLRAAAHICRCCQSLPRTAGARLTASVTSYVGRMRGVNLTGAAVKLTAVKLTARFD